MLILLVVAATHRAHAESYPQRADVKAYADELVEQHGFDKPSLLKLFAQAKSRDDIIERISRPAEKALTWERYRQIFMDDARLQQGLEFWQTHQQTLDAAAEKYGVAPEVILAILGVETRYGRVTGTFPVLDALMTLGFDYPPRSAFFRQQLTQLLILAREEGKDPQALMGSYAGAMGYGQFIPSSYRDFAVDFDGDGLRDIWNNPADAIGSIANYFAVHGWQGDRLVALQVSADAKTADAVANNGLEPSLTVAQLKQHGVTIENADHGALDGLGDDELAALFRLEGQNGIEYWLGLHDFYVITRYNHSHLYALAVYQLSQALKSARAE